MTKLLLYVNIYSITLAITTHRIPNVRLLELKAQFPHAFPIAACDPRL